MQSSWAYMQSGTYMKVQVWTKSRTSGLGYGVAPRFGAAIRVVTPCSVQYYCTIVNPVYFSVFCYTVLPCSIYLYSDLCSTNFKLVSRRSLVAGNKRNKQRRSFVCRYCLTVTKSGFDSYCQGVASSPTSLKFGVIESSI